MGFVARWSRRGGVCGGYGMRAWAEGGRGVFSLEDAGCMVSIKPRWGINREGRWVEQRECFGVGDCGIVGEEIVRMWVCSEAWVEYTRDDTLDGFAHAYEDGVMRSYKI